MRVTERDVVVSLVLLLRHQNSGLVYVGAAMAKKLPEWAQPSLLIDYKAACDAKAWVTHSGGPGIKGLAQLGENGCHHNSSDNYPSWGALRDALRLALHMQRSA